MEKCLGFTQRISAVPPVRSAARLTAPHGRHENPDTWAHRSASASWSAAGRRRASTPSSRPRPSRRSTRASRSSASATGSSTSSAAIRPRLRPLAIDDVSRVHLLGRLGARHLAREPDQVSRGDAGRDRDAAAGGHHAPRDDRRRRHGALVALRQRALATAPSAACTCRRRSTTTCRCRRTSRPSASRPRATSASSWSAT